MSGTPAARVLVVVASETGRTSRMAEAVAEGARETGAEVVRCSADDATGDHRLEADAVILGSGVHMGGIESSMRRFFERAAPLWLQGRLRGLALLSLLANLAEHGILLVSMPNRAEGFAEAGCH